MGIPPTRTGHVKVKIMETLSDPWCYNSRRSPVHSLNGIAASSQPLASSIGTDVLKRGGNAADAAVAVAAALNVLQPTSTGNSACLFD